MFERTVIGESLLFLRLAAGDVVALENRCCHRHAPLSLGRREGDCIRCMYHGLKFDPTGRCVEIPGQTRVPPRVRVHSYPVIERKRWIWVWMGAPEKADASLIPDTFSLDDPGWRMQPGYMRYAAHHLLVCDNLLDFSHLSYVHEGSLGGTSRTMVEHHRVVQGRLTVYCPLVRIRTSFPQTAYDIGVIAANQRPMQCIPSVVITSLGVRSRSQQCSNYRNIPRLRADHQWSLTDIVRAVHIGRSLWHSSHQSLPIEWAKGAVCAPGLTS